ncbi:MAG: hypothetical protein WDN69_09565 [Aliidongia sp.]
MTGGKRSGFHGAHNHYHAVGFLGDCARFHGLAAAVTKSQYLVPALTRDQRADVIRKPVEQCGATVDPAVVQRLLNDTSEDSDQLPVLQHAMMRIWMHATENGSAVAPHLGQDGYEAVGGIEYAISRHADEVLAELREQDPVSPLPYLSFDNVAKRLFQSLTVTDARGSNHSPATEIRRIDCCSRCRRRRAGREEAGHACHADRD